MAKIQKRGNRQGLRLAEHIVDNASISVRNYVPVVANEEKILIKKPAQAKFDLAEMVSRMPQNYQAKEESFGKRVGKEDW